MLLSPYANRFHGVITNMTGRPAAAWGTSITPGNNSFPAYTEIISDASVTYDCYDMVVLVSSVGVSGNAKDCLVTIGMDHSGGTTYTDNQIQNLLCSNAGTLIAGCGVFYRFPIYVPAGTAIAAKASVNNATVGTARIGIWLYGKPSHPELIRCGRYVDTFGATTASSSGTAVTSGTASEGSWTEMTSGTTTRPYWHFQAGFGANDGSLGSVTYGMDLSVGDASNKYVVFENDLVMSPLTTEQAMVVRNPNASQYVYEVADGQRIYTRLQCSGTADSSLSTCVYALGG